MMGSAKLNNAPSAQSSIGTRVMVVVDMDVVVDVTEVVVLVAVRVVLLTVAVVEETDVLVDVTDVVVLVMLTVVDVSVPVVLETVVVVDETVVEVVAKSAQHRIDASAAVALLHTMLAGSINDARDGTTK
jgi:hypothetical protein